MEHKKANIIIGRFQPFTRAHLKMVEIGFETNGLPTVILQIPNNKFDKLHPFSDDIIQEEIDIICHNYSDLICGHFHIANADIAKIAKICHENGFEPILWITGTDRYEAYSKQANNEKYKIDNCLLDEFKCLEIKRTNDDISATKTREAISNDDFESFSSMMPECVRNNKVLFGKLKEELSKIDK